MERIIFQDRCVRVLRHSVTKEFVVVRTSDNKTKYTGPNWWVAGVKACACRDLEGARMGNNQVRM